MSQQNNIDVYANHLRNRLQALFRSTNKVLSEDPHKRVLDMSDLALKAEEFESICDEMYTCIEINKQNIILNNLFDAPIESKLEPEDAYYRLATKTHSARETRKTTERFSKQLELNHLQLQKYLQQIREESDQEKQRLEQEKLLILQQQHQPQQGQGLEQQQSIIDDTASMNTITPSDMTTDQVNDQSMQLDKVNSTTNTTESSGDIKQQNIDTPTPGNTESTTNTTTTPSIMLEGSTPTINTTDVDMRLSAGGDGDVLNVASHLFKSSTGMPQTDSPGMMYSPHNQLKNSSGGIEKHTADTPHQHLPGDTPQNLFPSSPPVMKKDDDNIGAVEQHPEQEQQTTNISNIQHPEQQLDQPQSDQQQEKETINLDEVTNNDNTTTITPQVTFVDGGGDNTANVINIDGTNDDDDDANIEFEMVEAIDPAPAPVEEVNEDDEMIETSPNPQ